MEKAQLPQGMLISARICHGVDVAWSEEMATYPSRQGTVSLRWGQAHDIKNCIAGSSEWLSLLQLIFISYGSFKKNLIPPHAKISAPPPHRRQSSMQWEISGFHPGIASHSYLSVTQHELQANSSVYTEEK